MALRIRGNGEEAAGIVFILQRNSLPPKQLCLKKASRSGCAASRVVSRIGREQAVVDEELDLAAVEAKLAVQAWLGLQALRGGEGGARGLPQAVLIAAVERRFAVVAHAEAIVGVVHAVVAFLPDQDDSRAAAGTWR